jgi:hypothetical protein
MCVGGGCVASGAKLGVPSGNTRDYFNILTQSILINLHQPFFNLNSILVPLLPFVCIFSPNLSVCGHYRPGS